MGEDERSEQSEHRSDEQQDDTRHAEQQKGGQQKDDKQASGQNGGDKDEQRSQGPKSRWPWFLGGFVVLAFVGVVLGIIFLPADSVWTDDAYVTSHFATIAPRISGQVTAVHVEDNQPVRAGEELVTIDDRDYRATLAQARAMLARDQAQAQDIVAEIARLPTEVAQQQAMLASDVAQRGFAEENQARYRNLAAAGSGSQQQRQQADTALRQARAGVDRGRSAVAGTVQELPILQARLAAMRATVKSDQAEVRQAELNLSYTRVLAPLDGSIAERAVQVGNYVAPGAALMAVVPLGRLFITANYRETALRHVRPGQHARIHVDAYDIYLDGVVDSLPPASGASFAPIQPNNATGNFTKIVQRLPLKVDVLPAQREALLLKQGFSVEVTVDTGDENIKALQARSTSPVTVP